MKKYVLPLAILLVFLSLITSHATVEVVCFDGEFIRATGTPITELRTFQGINSPANIKLWNGGAQDSETEKMSSSTVTVNGSVVFGPSNFNQNVGYLEAIVTLNQGDNTLEVLLKSKPGGKIWIEIVQDIHSDTVSGHIKIPPSTKVIYEAAQAYIISTSDDVSVFVFDQAIQQLLSLSVGDIIVIGVTNHTGRKATGLNPIPLGYGSRAAERIQRLS